MRIWCQGLALVSTVATTMFWGGCVKPTTTDGPSEPSVDPASPATIEPPPVARPSSVEEPTPPSTEDPCEGHEGLLLSPPAAIEADWQGAVTMGGKGPLDITWCGEGIVVVRTVHVMQLGPEGKTDRIAVEYELTRERGTLAPSGTLTMDIHAPAQPGPLGVVVVAHDSDGNELVARTTVEAIDDRERTAKRDACLAAGGTWKARGMLGIESCDQPTKDAGARCLSSADCEGACLDDGDEPIDGNLPAGVEVPSCGPGLEPRLLVGKCDSKTLRFGCHARLRRVTVECVSPGFGRRKHVICVD